MDDSKEDDSKELEGRFWNHLKADRIVMLGIDGTEDGHSRPMTAIVENESGPIWFFTGKDNAIVENLHKGNRAIAAFSSKGHDLFASIHGSISVSNDREVIDRLYNAYIGAWFEGKDDPDLVLLRFDPETAEIWFNESSLLSGVKMLFGVDPNQDAKSANIKLHGSSVAGLTPG